MTPWPGRPTMRYVPSVPVLSRKTYRHDFFIARGRGQMRIVLERVVHDIRLERLAGLFVRYSALDQDAALQTDVEVDGLESARLGDLQCPAHVRLLVAGQDQDVVAPPLGESDQPIPTITVGGRFDLMKESLADSSASWKQAMCTPERRRPCLGR